MKTCRIGMTRHSGFRVDRYVYAAPRFGVADATVTAFFEVAPRHRATLATIVAATIVANTFGC